MKIWISDPLISAKDAWHDESMREIDSKEIILSRVKELMAIQGKNQREVALTAGIDPSRFNRFYQGTGGVTVDEIFRLARAFHVPIRMIVSSENEEANKSQRTIPVLYLRNLPAISDQKEALSAMIQFRHRWEQTYREDPRAYAIDLTEPFQDCLAGDVLIFSDSQPPQPRDIIVASKGQESALAVAAQVKADLVAILKDGSVWVDFVYRGRMIQLIRNR